MRRRVAKSWPAPKKLSDAIARRASSERLGQRARSKIISFWLRHCWRNCFKILVNTFCQRAGNVCENGGLWRQEFPFRGAL